MTPQFGNDRPQNSTSLLIHFVLVFIGIPNSVFIVIPIAGYVNK